MQLKTQAYVGAFIAMCLGIYIVYDVYPRHHYDAETSTMYAKQERALIVPVTFGTVTLDAIVDTGASDTSVSSTVIVELINRAHAMRVGQGKVSLADGRLISASQYMISSVRIGSCVVTHEVVYEIPGADYALFGLSTLDKLGAHINVSKGSIHFETCTKEK